MTNLNCVLKSRDITWPTKVRIVKAMVFPVVMYGCENWTIKKAKYRRIDAFELWCWRRLLRVPWTARRSNQSILKEINVEYSLEGLTWCKELTDWKRPLCWERLKVGGEWDDRGWDGWMASLTGWTWVWTSSGRMVKDREVWHAAVLGVAKTWTLLSYWTTTRTEILEWVSIPMDRGTWWAIVHGVTKTQT